MNKKENNLKTGIKYFLSKFEIDKKSIEMF
jgi:hypothetical protein